MHETSTSGTATINAYRLQKNNTDYDAAMWAACALMVLHSERSDILRDYAHIWASKLKPGGSQ